MQQYKFCHLMWCVDTIIPLLVVHSNFSLCSSTDVIGQESPESDFIISHHEQIAFWGHINNTARCEEFISNEIAEIFPLHQVGQPVQPLSD